MRRLRRLRRLGRHLVDDNIMNISAMLAYYAVLALFPLLVFVVSIALLVLPHDTLDQGVRMATEAVPPELRSIVTDRMNQLISAANSRFAVTGAVLAIWGASRGAVTLGQALNQLFGRQETRSWVRRQLISIAVTLGVAAMLLAALALLVVGPIVGHWLQERFGFADTFGPVWLVMRWVGAGALLLVMWAVAYHFLPDTDARLRIFTPGALLGVVLWLAASWGFGVYLGHARTYETTYGALGSGIAFLTWLWLSNMALLVGAEINDVLDDTHPRPGLAGIAPVLAKT
jgi:membrane protein